MQREAGEVDPGADDALVVVGVDADRVGLEVEGVLAILDLLQLVLVQVGPPPYARVDHVREPLPARHLENNVKQISTAGVQGVLDLDQNSGLECQESSIPS